MDWETCMTMNNTWGYSEHDQNWKSSEALIRQLIDVASRGGNYLLNIGPKGDGSIPEPSIRIMADIGEWMELNSEAIHGTTKSPIGKPDFDGRITAKGAVHYLHLFSRPENGRVTVPLAGSKATLLKDGRKLKVVQSGGELIIHLPSRLPDAVATVIRLE